MKFLLSISLLLATAAAAPSAAEKHPHKSHNHSAIDLNLDSAIVNRLEALFANPQSYPGAPVPTKSALERRAIDTRDDLIQGKCNEVIVIFARGTTSPGNIGDGEGPAFIDAITDLRPGKVIAQGVLPYAATVAGYLAGGDSKGADSMVSLTERAASQCPSAKIVWGGYSQGAQVAHKAAARLSSSLYSRISSIVFIGDPNDGDALPGALNSKWRTWCNEDDYICDGIPLPIGAHLAYEQHAPAMAQWVVSRL